MLLFPAGPASTGGFDEQLALWDCEALLPSLVACCVKDARLSVLPARAHLQSLRVEVLNVPVEPSLGQRCSWVDLGALARL